MPPFTTAAAAAAAAAAVANTSRARRSRTFALWVVTFAVLLGRQLLVHHRMFPDPMTPTEPVSFGAQPSEVVTIGVAVTVTGCHASFPLDGAIVLKHSFLRHPSERYRYQFYAIYHPEAAKCVPMLADAGYVLLERPTPVNVSAIRGEYLRRTIPTAGT